MQNSTVRLAAALAIATAACTFGPAAWAQQPPPDKADQTQNDPKPMPSGNMVITTMPGGGGRMVRMGGPGMAFGNDELAPVVSLVGELNLSPNFNLTAEQKQKIQTIR